MVTAMTVAIVASLAAVVVAFALLVDNKRNRTLVQAHKQALDEYMASFFNRLDEVEQNAAKMKKDVNDFSFMAGKADRELENKLKALSESVAQTVDNMTSAVMEMKDEVKTQRQHITTVQEVTLALVSRRKRNGRKVASKSRR